MMASPRAPASTRPAALRTGGSSVGRSAGGGAAMEGCGGAHWGVRGGGGAQAEAAQPARRAEFRRAAEARRAAGAAGQDGPAAHRRIDGDGIRQWPGVDQQGVEVERHRTG